VEDWIFRFHPDGTIEDLVSYWNRMVSVAFQGDKGLIEVEVRAFDPREAQAISSAILRNSEEMINRLSQEAEGDATRYARAELERAEDRLREARQALTTYRSVNQIIDPEAVVAAQMGLLNSLQQQLADTLIEYDLLRDVTRPNDPRIEQAQRKIEVIESRIGQEKRKLGDVDSDAVGGDRPVTEIVGRFEELRVDLEFAEQSYLTARAAFDGALEKARRNSRYLATYKPPTLAESAQYPEKITILGIFTLFVFLVWAVFALVLYSVRDRR
jgi:capsular polysaccharide transport system permease protein